MPSSSAALQRLSFPIFCFLVFAGVGCSQKAQVRAECHQHAVKVAELTPLLKQLDAQIAALDLQNPQSPERRYNEFVAQIEFLKSEGLRLRERVEEQKQTIQQAEKRLSDYRKQFGGS